MTFKNPYVDINLPFGAYYVENVGKTAYEMSPPSEKQMAEGIEYIIEQELLELENNPPEQTGESQDLSSKSIPEQWSIEEYQEALEWHENKNMYKGEVDV